MDIDGSTLVHVCIYILFLLFSHASYQCFISKVKLRAPKIGVFFTAAQKLQTSHSSHFCELLLLAIASVLQPQLQQSPHRALRRPCAQAVRSKLLELEDFEQLSSPPRKRLAGGSGRVSQTTNGGFLA